MQITGALHPVTNASVLSRPNTYATVLEEWEGDTSGISQKTCKTKSKNCPFEESGQCVSGFKIIFAYFVWREELKYG